MQRAAWCESVFLGTESSTLGGADRLLCLGAPLLPPHSCNQPKGVIFTAEIETCESSSLFPQEIKVQLGLDESLCRSREGRHPLHTQTPPGPLGGWTGHRSSPCCQNPDPALVPLPGEGLQSLAKSCRKEGKTWEIPVEEEQERAEKVNVLGG